MERVPNSLRRVRLTLLPLFLVAAWGVPECSGAGVINSCVTYCHGLPPQDGPRTGSSVDTPTNSSFVGNHRQHAVASAASCAKCHPGSAAYSFGHMTGVEKPVLKLASNLNGSPVTAQYLKSGVPVTFANQTTVPLLGSCSNVNCHFGSATETWGTTPYAVADSVTCAKCHGAPPASANHAKHFQAFGATVSSCARCHPDHSAESAKFQHATSASPGGRNLAVSFAGAPNGTGSYTPGSHVAYPNYFSTTVGYGSCSALYCHGGATPAWGGGALACNACHGASNNGSLSAGAGAGHAIHYNSATVFVNMTGRDATTPAAYAFGCKNCHPTGSHANGPASGLSAAEIGGTRLSALQYTPAASPLLDANGFGYTAGSCATNGCHGNGQGGAPLAALSWGSAATGSCVLCHDTRQSGGTPTLLSGRHDRHMNPTSNPMIGSGNGLDCVSCHVKTVSANTTLSDRTRHANGLADYSGVRAGGSARYNAVTKQCSTVYCHSNGNPAAAIYVTMTGSKLWSGSGTISCNGCHGRSNSLGTPDYQNGGAGAATANSHAKHVSGAVATTICADCHLKTVSLTVTGRFKDFSAATYHLNGARDVAFNPARAGAAASFAASGAICSNVACHGGSGSSAAWGATLNCQDCHGNGAAASTEDFGATFWNNGVISKIRMTGVGSFSVNGHGLAAGSYPGSGNPAANFAVQAKQCEFCHDASVPHNLGANPFRLLNYSTAAYGRSAPCLVCHSATGTGVTVNGTLKSRTSSAAVEADHYGSKHSSTLSGGQFCWDCHEPHGTGNANQFMVRANPALASDRTTGAPTTQSATAVTFTLSATPTGTDYAKSVGPFTGVCNVCHTTTNHYTASAGDGHNSGSRCTSCHGHAGSAHGNNAFTPVGGGESSGGAACSGCHSDLAAAMSGTTGYHHYLNNTNATAATIAQPAQLAGGADPSRNCLICHVDHNLFRPDLNPTSGGRGRNLRADISTAPAAGTATSFTNTDFLNSGTGGVCLSCHVTAQAPVGYTQPDGSTSKPAIPYPDATANQVAAYNGSSHQYGVGSTFGGTLVASFTGNCVKCHNDTMNPKSSVAAQSSAAKFGLHQSTLRSVTAPLGVATPTDPLEETFCYQCHSQVVNGKGKGANGFDWYGGQAMSAAAEDTFNSFSTATRLFRHRINRYTGLHGTTETLATLGANQHVGCSDCHNPHAARFGNHSSTAPGTARGLRPGTIAGVLAGAAGVKNIAAAAWTQMTYSSGLGPARREYQVCFKCHSNAMGGTGWFRNMTSATAMGGKSRTWTNLGLEFNPANRSFHPLVAALNGAGSGSTALAATQLVNGWKPGDRMTCTDCHNTDSTASRGPHGSAVKWMLKGPNRAWPYTSAANNGGSTGTLFTLGTRTTGQGTANGLFCLNCHPSAAVNTAHSTGNHNSISCASCHLRVPHGGKVSRLILTVNAPARYFPNGTDKTINASFNSFIKAATPTGYAENGNCNSTCGHHSGGAAGEAW